MVKEGSIGGGVEGRLDQTVEPFGATTCGTLSDGGSRCMLLRTNLKVLRCIPVIYGDVAKKPLAYGQHEVGKCD